MLEADTVAEPLIPIMKVFIVPMTGEVGSVKVKDAVFE